MHRREHVVILRPYEHGIVAHTMYHVDEIRSAPGTWVETESITEKELVVAEAFIKALAEPFEPGSFRDEYRAGIEALIAGKVQAEEITAATSLAKATKSADIIDALKASLEKLRVTRAPQRVQLRSSTTSKSRKRTA